MIHGWVALIDEVVSRHADWSEALDHVAAQTGLPRWIFWFRDEPDGTWIFRARAGGERVARVFDPIQYQRARSNGDLEDVPAFFTRRAGAHLPDPALQRNPKISHATTMNTTADLIPDETEKLTFTVLHKLQWKGSWYFPANEAEGTAADEIEATEAETRAKGFPSWIEYRWVERKGQAAAPTPPATPAPAKANGRAPAEIEFQVVTSIVRHGETLEAGARFTIKRTSSRVHVDRWLEQGKIREVLPSPTMEEALEKALGLKVGHRLRGLVDGVELWEVEGWFPDAVEGPVLRLMAALKQYRGGLHGRLGIPVHKAARDGDKLTGQCGRDRCEFVLLPPSLQKLQTVSGESSEPRTFADADAHVIARVPRAELEAIGKKIECMKLSGWHKKEKAPRVETFEFQGAAYVAVSGSSRGAGHADGHGRIEVEACPVLRPVEIVAASVPDARDHTAGRMSHYGQAVTVGGKPMALGRTELRLVRSDCDCEDCQRVGGGIDAPAAPIPQTPSAEIVEAIPRERIDRSHYNPREDFDASPKAAAAFAGLVESVRVQGIIQPLIVTPTAGRPGYYTIVAGERRWRAADRLGLETVPCIVRTLAKVKLLEQQALENLQRQNLNAIEEGQQYKTLRDEGGLTVPEIEKRTGISEPTIYSRIKLLELPPGIRQAVISGRLKATTADLIAREEDYDFQCACMDAIMHPEASESIDDGSIWGGAPVLSFRAAKAWIATNREPFLANADWKKRQHDSHRFNDAARVLSIEESNGALWPGGNVRETQAWVRPGDPCFDDAQKRTFEQLAEAAGITLPAPVLARDPERGGPVVLLPRGETETALAAKFPEVGAYKRRQAEEEKRREQERQQADRVRQDAAVARVGRAKDTQLRCVATPWTDDYDEAFLRLLVLGNFRALLNEDKAALESVLLQNLIDVGEEDELDAVWIEEYLAGCDRAKLRGWLLYFHLRAEAVALGADPAEATAIDEDRLFWAEAIFCAGEPRTSAGVEGKEVAA